MRVERCKPLKFIIYIAQGDIKLQKDHFIGLVLGTSSELERTMRRLEGKRAIITGAGTQTDKVSMLNFLANRLCCDALDQAIQTHGGLGFSRNKPFEHLYRHHRRYRITEGANEIQMRRVAGFMFGTMGSKKEMKS